MSYIYICQRYPRHTSILLSLPDENMCTACRRNEQYARQDNCSLPDSATLLRGVHMNKQVCMPTTRTPSYHATMLPEYSTLHHTTVLGVHYTTLHYTTPYSAQPKRPHETHKIKAALGLPLLISPGNPERLCDVTTDVTASHCQGHPICSS